MRDYYTDERLAMLLAHAQSGHLAFYSCCCFVGVSNAKHALRGEGFTKNYFREHLGGHPMNNENAALTLSAIPASKAYCSLSNHAAQGKRDANRRRILIPMIKAEMRRREQLRQQAEWKQELVEMST